MSTTEKVVREVNFELVDPAGHVRATLAPNGTQAHSLTSYDRTGTPRAGIRVLNGDGPALMQLMGPASTVALVVEPDGTAKIVVQAHHGHRVGLGLNPDGMATLTSFDAASVLRAAVMLEAEKEDGGIRVDSEDREEPGAAV